MEDPCEDCLIFDKDNKEFNGCARVCRDKIVRLMAELKAIKDEYAIKSQGHDYYILESIEKVE
jgi:hypothetical protein